MPTTTNRGNPYPLNTAAAQVWTDVQALAQALDLVPDIDKGTSFPGSPKANMLFRRTDQPNKPLYIWTGSAWELLTLRQSSGSTLPADGAGVEGERFWRTSDDSEWRHNGTTWKRVTFAAQTALVPTGGILDFGGALAPDGWLLCDGSLFLRTDFPDLFAAIGTSFNTGGESGTQFRVPDYRGRVGVGLDNMDNVIGTGGGDAGRLSTANTMGAAGGAESLPITVGNLPQHQHYGTVIDNTHNHPAVLSKHVHSTYVVFGNTFGFSGTVDPNTSFVQMATTGTGFSRPTAGHQHTYSGSVAVSFADTFNSSEDSFTGNPAHSVNEGITVQNSTHNHGFTGGDMVSGGSATPYNKMQPFINVNKIIKT